VKRFVPVLAVIVLAVMIPSARAAEPKPAKTDAKAAATPAVTDSLGLLERAVAKDSTKFDNLYKLGVMYLDREKNAEAALVFSKANRVKPKNAKVLVNLGVALDNLSRSDEAQAYYRQALTVSPNDSLAGCRLATSLYAQGKFSDSMTLLRDLVARQPRSYCAFFQIRRRRALSRLGPHVQEGGRAGAGLVRGPERQGDDRRAGEVRERPVSPARLTPR